MTSLLECNARAALCRQLARLEPDSKSLWLAEAERWSRLTQAPNVTVVTRRCEPLGVKVIDVQFEFRDATGSDAFEEFLGMPFEASEPN